jgi:hypothetical protein
MIESAGQQTALQINPLRQIGKTRYVFTPVRLSLDGREIISTPMRGELRKLDFLPAFEIAQITDQRVSYRGSTDEEIRNAEEASPLKERIKTSFEIVDELLGAWGDRGLVWLETLDDAPGEAVAELEERLLARAPKETAQGLLEYLGGVALPGAAEPVRQALIASVESYAVWLRNRIDAVASEISRARIPGSQSIRTFFTADEHERAAWLGMKLKDLDIGIEPTGQAEMAAAGLDVAALGAAIGVGISQAMPQQHGVDDERIAQIAARVVAEMRRAESAGQAETEQSPASAKPSGQKKSAEQRSSGVKPAGDVPL